MDVLAPGTGGANGWLCGSAGGMEGAGGSGFGSDQAMFSSWLGKADAVIASRADAMSARGRRGSVRPRTGHPVAGRRGGGGWSTQQTTGPPASVLTRLSSAEPKP